jgi:acetylornithine deacetylase/succinyl-diaminopimelate desuccinylase family protein
VSVTLGARPTETEERVLRAIEETQDELFEYLKTLVRFRTPNPPAGNELEAQEWVEGRLRALDMEIDRWDVLPGRPNVVGTASGAGSGPSVVLNSHIDVCEDRLLEHWSSDPYEPVIDGRDMIGRGASDMKCALASFLYAFETLQRLGVSLAGDVIIQSVIGEEAGEPGTRSAIERGYKGDFAIVGESSSGVGLVACIGVMNARITIESPKTLHLVHRKFTINAGGQLEGANCVEKMALRILPALADLERHWGVFKVHPLVPPGACNINVFRFEGGANTFILPDRCTAYITVTYLPSERKADVAREVEEHVARAAALDPWLRKHPPVIEWGPEEYPIEFASSDIDPESEPVQLLQDAIRVAAGREPVLGGRGGITDAGWFFTAGVPTVVFGPGDVNYAHAIDERVHLDDVVNHCKATALFLIRYCGTA